MYTRNKSFLRGFVLCLILVCLWFGPAVCGFAKDKDDDPGEDPYTKNGDVALMQAAGYERFGPFPVTYNHTTDHVEKVIGAKWMLWVETKHFKIGCKLGEVPVCRNRKDSYKRLNKELARLRGKLPSIKKKVSKLDEWLTLHLYAQRLEELYEDFCERFGVTESTFPVPGDEDKIQRTNLGPYLGCKGKFVVVLLEQEADVARYLASYMEDYRKKVFCYKVRVDDCLLFAGNRDAFASYQDEDCAFFCHVTTNMVRNMTRAYRGYKYNLPLWWSEGLVHWYSRRIDPEFYSPINMAEQKMDTRKDYKWEKKVLARVKNDYFRPAEELLKIDDPREMEHADHMMSWSRVDYLLSLGPEKVGKFMWTINELPWSNSVTFEDVLRSQDKALKEAWGLDAISLDEQWAEWVLKEYKKKRRG